MTLIQLSLLFLLVISNGPGANSSSGPNDEERLTSLIARFVAKEKERYETMVRKMSGMTGTLKGALNRIEQEETNLRKELSKMQDYFVDRLNQHDNYTEESRNKSPSDAAGSFSNITNQPDNGSANQPDYGSANLSLTENGWIIFQRRRSFKVDFNRNWNDYKNGFGSRDDDFWLGLETLHKITSSGNYELRVVLTAKGRTEFASYSNFSVTDENDGYRLKYGIFLGGGAGNSLNFHKDMKFSTPDRDNDVSSKEHCAKDQKSGWWFNKCWFVDLNTNTPFWHAFPGTWYLSATEMKIRQLK